MRNLKILVVGLLLAVPALAIADAEGVPGDANWYFYVDLEQMRSGGPGAAMYEWLRDEVLNEVKRDAGIDVDKELHRIASYSTNSDSAVVIFEGKFSQETRDVVMAFVASGGDISPLKSGGTTYYHFGGDDSIEEDVVYDAGNVGFKIDSLGEESWVSLDIKDKIIITSTENHMKALLANKGRVTGSRSVDGALMVLTAEKAFVQAGMKSGMLDNEDWDSNILKNTEQVAFMIAAVADKLAIEAKLITKEAEMAESLASVVRGLISLMSFDDELDAETAAVLQGTRVEAKGNSLSLSLAVAPELIVQTLGD